ncbi:PqqD family peptide modification chaperone [Elizabethkingia argentiflava]|uniref:PqqD family peptide modification chaperone n=1 Tax=Elizabethkingia argenteiflava TaxID=2681556 RepID=A0A845PUL4_9FLAO|nr:PqqD family protein [Elizabethkingia argenteiflava]NAW51345.1 PqqD family peptide modification chaperone [Elizabethkingia argenteiflava]
MRLREDLMLRHLGDEYVIIEPEQDMVDMSKVFTLNETAAVLWEALQGKEFSIEAIVEELLSRYNVERDVAEDDARKLVDNFKKQGLLTD